MYLVAQPAVACPRHLVKNQAHLLPVCAYPWGTTAPGLEASARSCPASLAPPANTRPHRVSQAQSSHPGEVPISPRSEIPGKLAFHSPWRVYHPGLRGEMRQPARSPRADSLMVTIQVLHVFISLPIPYWGASPLFLGPLIGGGPELAVGSGSQSASEVFGLVSRQTRKLWSAPHPDHILSQTHATHR